ncbi:MAG: ribonuclease H-like domain-containing protein [Eubacterium sp.]|nr:ribonuclease H-like domain-containing protein [Eubacterium sp.]
MLVIKDEAKINVDYPMEKFADKDKILYFDIETTGLSRKYCSIYLIGAMYFDEGKWMYAQWFADNYNDEANVIMAFQKFIKDYDCLIHFNGNSFDIPFVKERAEKYNIDLDLDRLKSVDIYKDISSLKNILNLPNLKQKTLEEAIGIKRMDPFSGGELVEVYKEYVRTKDQKLIYPLLLHNREDVLYMGKITEFLLFVICLMENSV